MLVCDTGRALSLASIPLAYALGRLTIWQLYAAALIEGALLVAFSLAKTAAITQVAPPTQLAQAVVQDEVAEGVTGLARPALSGALYTLGAMVPFLVDAVSYVVSLVTLALIRTPLQGDRARAPQNLWAEIGSGVRWVWRQPFILSVTLMMGAGSLVYPGATRSRSSWRSERTAPAWMIGLRMFAAEGVGGVLGAWLTPRIAHRLTVGPVHPGGPLVTSR